MAGAVATSGRRYDRTIAMRLADEHAILIDTLRATFPENSVGVAMRWLLDEPAVREAIARRVQGG